MRKMRKILSALMLTALLLSVNSVCYAEEDAFAEADKPVETAESEQTPPPEQTPVPEQTPAPEQTPPPEQTPEPTPPEEPILTLPTALEIDTENIYRGMDKAYKDGYIPTVKDGKVYVVLPLIPSGEVYGDKITVTPDFSGAGTTFVVSNYQKTVNLTEEKINHTEETRKLFYVDFELPLSASRANGTFPLIIKIKAYDKSGTPIDSQFTVYVNITDVPVEETPVFSGGGGSTPTAEPIVLISKCEITPEKAVAGEQFTMKLTLKNSLETKSVENMLVSVDTGNLQINIEDDSNVFQIKGIEKGGTTELEVHFSSDKSIPAGKYVVSFSFSYDSGQTLKLSSSGSVVVEIKQPANMELVMPKIPDKVNAGETLPLSFQVMNMGRDSMYNVRCEISGYGLLPVNTGYIGTMAAGTSSTAKIDLYIGSLLMSEDYTGSEKYGDTTGTVKLIYEDASGEEFCEERQFETTIGSPIITGTVASANPEAEEEAAASQWWISVLILLVVIAAVAAFVILRRRSIRHESARH